MMTDDELKAIEARANAALEDTSFVLRVNLWLTAGDGRQFCAAAITDIPLLIADLRAAREALRFYADYLNWHRETPDKPEEPGTLGLHRPMNCSQQTTYLIPDRGRRARKALGEE